jgi:hypothetical protein
MLGGYQEAEVAVLASKNQADGLLASNRVPETDIPISHVHWL